MIPLIRGFNATRVPAIRRSSHHKFICFLFEFDVANMTRARTIVFSLVLSFCCALNKGLAYSVYAEERDRVVGDEAFASDIIDWPCESNLDCQYAVNMSTCVDGACQCPAGFVFNEKMTACIKVATGYGDRCEESIQCSRYLFTGGVCMNAICVCAEGYYYMHGRCNAYSGLFETCLKDDDCYIIGDFEATSCRDGVCKCSDGYYQREYRSCRRAAKAMGDKCVIDSDCRQLNSAAHCDFDNSCALTSRACRERRSLYKGGDTVEEDDETANETGISIGSSCTKDADCEALRNAFCEPTGTCVCKRANFYAAEVGVCVPELGEPCKPEDNVTIEYSECRNGIWYCEKDRAISSSNRKCEKIIKRYNNFCRADIQCSAFGPDAICNDNKVCVCNENSRFNETELYCWMKREIGESCRQDLDCYIENGDVKLSCVEGTCSCPSGTHPNSNRTDCVSTSAGIGSRCEEDSDCITGNATCVGQVCTCIQHYYQFEDECLPGIQAACAGDEDCTPENSECKGDTCACKGNFVASAVDSCIPQASVGEPCEEDVQCSSKIANSFCSQKAENSTTNSTCACLDHYHYNLDRCFERKVLGMRCNSIGECYLDSGIGAVCKNGRCACDWGYTRLNDTVCDGPGRNDKSGQMKASATGLLAVFFLLINRLV